MPFCWALRWYFYLLGIFKRHLEELAWALWWDSSAKFCSLLLASPSWFCLTQKGGIMQEKRDEKKPVKDEKKESDPLSELHEEYHHWRCLKGYDEDKSWTAFIEELHEKCRPWG